MEDKLITLNLLPKLLAGIRENYDMSPNIWQASTKYTLNKIVFYDDELYRCIEEHTSSAKFDDTKFSKVRFRIPNWEKKTQYQINELVLYNNEIYRCIVEHTSSNTTFETAYWQIITGNRSATDGGNGNGNVTQVTLTNASAGQQMSFIVNGNNKLPIEVLTVVDGKKDQVVAVENFGLNRIYNCDKTYVNTENLLTLKTIYDIKISDCVEISDENETIGYISKSEYIDLNTDLYKSIEGIM